MLYSLNDFMLLSLIYSDFDKGKFPKPALEHKSLYSLFWKSLEESVNIFEADSNILRKLIFEVTKQMKSENPRIDIEKRTKALNEFFIEDKERLKKLRLRIEKEFELCNEYDIKYITYFSNEYPVSLKELKDPPFMLFYKGYLPKNSELQKSLAIIGTRNPEERYGKEIAKRSGKLLADIGWWNISGLAIGCDEYGHKGSLGATGAILAQGLIHPIFPKENKRLAEEILETGGFLMSELPPSTPICSIFFILRDRLQSGMTKGIFVVETSNKSGTLHTVKYSLEQGRETIIWDPSSIEDLKNVNEVLGNLMLIGKAEQKDDFNVTIKKELKKNIVLVKDSQELREILEKLGVKKFDDSKILKKKETRIFNETIQLEII